MMMKSRSRNCQLTQPSDRNPAETTRNTVNGGLMCTNDRFAARLSGRAFGLARANGPLGWQRLQCSRVGACAHRLGDATGGSALDAGGASPDNARQPRR
jgi:hypothetical protein